jgi:glucarate dehydratase
MDRRGWLRSVAASPVAAFVGASFPERTALAEARGEPPLRIMGLKVTPIALPDPPLLAASGCHGPYFLRNVVELAVEGGIVGIAEVPGGEGVTAALNRATPLLIGTSAFAYRRHAERLMALDPGCYAGIELACLDACGKATGRRVCELLGGPVRDNVEFAAYLFYRYAADHALVLGDSRRVDRAAAGGARPIDAWGEVRTPEAMAGQARAFQRRWGFRVFKLKGGVLPPDRELESLEAMASALGPDCRLRIDPNARWTMATALRVGTQLGRLPMEYYEDPVPGQAAMAEVRRQTGQKMSTNMCVTRFGHIPEAVRLRPIDVLLCDHHYFGGFAGCQALGPISRAAGWTLSQHSNSHAGVTMAAMIHLAASVPELTLASDTHYPWLPDDADIIVGPKLAIRDGRMEVPPGPGLGVSLRRDRLARAHETYVKSGMRGRNDASLMRRLEPGWDGRRL